MFWRHNGNVHTRKEVENIIAGAGLVRRVDYTNRIFRKIYRDVVERDKLNEGPVPEYIVHSVRKRYI